MSVCIDFVRHFWHHHIKGQTAFECSIIKLVHYTPSHWDYFNLAFTLKGGAELCRKGVSVNNERLEYLGDAVLESIVSHYLYRKFPNQNEGYLTETRSAIVKRTTLNELGKNLSFHELIQPKEMLQSDNSYGNVFEALVGAVFLDAGYDRCNTFVIDIIESQLHVDKVLNKALNYKSLLIEYCQKNHLNYSFNLIEEQRVDGNGMRFQTQVIVNDTKCGLGVGSTKRISEQNASKHTLSMLKKLSKTKAQSA